MAAKVLERGAPTAYLPPDEISAAYPGVEFYGRAEAAISSGRLSTPERLHLLGVIRRRLEVEPDNPEQSEMDMNVGGNFSRTTRRKGKLQD